MWRNLFRHIGRDTSECHTGRVPTLSQSASPALSSESVLHKRVHIVVQLLCQSDSFMLSLHALHVHTNSIRCSMEFWPHAAEFSVTPITVHRCI